MDTISLNEFFGLILTAGALIVAIIGLNHKLKAIRQKSQKELVSEYERHESRMKTLENDTANVRKEVEEMQKERLRIVAQINTDIKDLRKLHDNDIDTVHAEIKELVSEVRTQNEQDHKELKTILSGMNDRLVTICTQFADHKEELKSRMRTRQK
jgi:formyltetrahydrofolate synthetase